MHLQDVLTHTLVYVDDELQLPEVFGTHVDDSYADEADMLMHHVGVSEKKQTSSTHYTEILTVLADALAGARNGMQIRPRPLQQCLRSSLGPRRP